MHADHRFHFDDAAAILMRRRRKVSNWATRYDVPTYADLDLAVDNTSYFQSQYGIAFTNVTDRGWTGRAID